jgi:hypothetical protein
MPPSWPRRIIAVFAVFVGRTGPPRSLSEPPAALDALVHAQMRARGIPGLEGPQIAASVRLAPNHVALVVQF